jgi:hypothetical protein
VLARPVARHWIVTRSILVAVISIAYLLAMMAIGTWIGLSFFAAKNAAWPSEKTIKRGPGKWHLEGKDFHLADEIRSIQCRAAEHDGRLVTVGPLALFSTDTGDAWLLDAEDHLTARLARDGYPEDIHFEERYALRHRLERQIPN